MKRETPVRVTVIAILALAGLSSTQVAYAGTGSSSTSAGTVVVQFPDVVLDGSGLCFEAPISAEATVKPRTEWFVSVKFRAPGTVPLSSTGRLNLLNSGETKGTIQICPSDGVGRMIVDGEFTTLEFEEPYTNAEADFTTDFTISRAPTAIELKNIKITRGVTKITGKVTTESKKYGTVTTYGDIIVQYQRAGSKSWKVLAKVPTGREGFEATSAKALPRNTAVRILFSGNEFALSSSSVTRSN